MQVPLRSVKALNYFGATAPLNSGSQLVLACAAFTAVTIGLSKRWTHAGAKLELEQ
jgi:hypothetical protein